MLDGPTRVHVGRWADLHEEKTAVRDLARARFATARPEPRDREIDTPTLDTSDEGQRATIVPAAKRVVVARRVARRGEDAADDRDDPMVAWLGEGPALYATLGFCALGLVALGVLVSLTVMLLVR